MDPKTDPKDDVTGEPRDTGRRKWFAAGGVGAAIAAGVGALILKNRGAPLSTKLVAASSKGALPIDDPASSAWDRATPCRVPLLPQQMFYPRLKQPTLQALVVRALFDGKQAALLLEWDDAAADAIESTATFRDAVAVMVPAASGALPPIFMGAPGSPVHVLHWKASWQRDVDEGFQDVEKAYPRWHDDVYPGYGLVAALGLSGEVAAPFHPGRAAHNELSRSTRTSPVEQLVAEGFGTLTTAPTQVARGRGVHDGKRWRVALGTPIDDKSFPPLSAGKRQPVSFAVWEGANKQVGGRKHYANWLELELPAG